jgi:hypothetical protein
MATANIERECGDYTPDQETLTALADKKLKEVNP